MGERNQSNCGRLAAKVLTGAILSIDQLERAFVFASSRAIGRVLGGSGERSLASDCRRYEMTLEVADALGQLEAAALISELRRLSMGQNRLERQRSGSSHCDLTTCDWLARRSDQNSKCAARGARPSAQSSPRKTSPANVSLSASALSPLPRPTLERAIAFAGRNNLALAVGRKIRSERMLARQWLGAGPLAASRDAPSGRAGFSPDAHKATALTVSVSSYLIWRKQQEPTARPSARTRLRPRRR